MKGARGRDTRRQHLAVLSVALLLLAVALCSFHGSVIPAQPNDAFFGLCASMVLLLVALLFVPKLAAIGWVPLPPPRLLYLLPLDLLDQPPEPCSAL